MIVSNPTPNLINENVINVLEKYLNYKLPKSYKLFLINTNGGKSEKSYFLMKANNSLGSVRNFLGLHIEYYLSLLEHKKIYEGRIPNNTVAICNNSSGNLILLSVKGPDYGKVYFWDHERETEPADYSNLTLIADSFEEFIQNLKSPEEVGLEE